MTTLLTRADIEALAAASDGPRVSLYVPTHRAGREVLQDPIRFKNLLRAAEEDLVAQGVRGTTARELLAPAWDLLDDQDFWRHQGDGLAAFLSMDDWQAYRLPLAVPELQVVADRYHLKPMLSLFSGDGRFYVLALSLNHVRLYEASRDTIRPIDLHDIPESLRDAVGYDWEQRSLQFHTGTGEAQGASRRAMFHGHGSPRDDDDAEVRRFLQQVDDGILRLLQDDRVPMVLAGVDRLMAEYRAVTRSEQVLDDGVAGNPDHRSGEELQAAAWEIVAPRFAAEQRAAAERYAALRSSGRTADRLSTVLRGAVEGRVDTLFAALGEQCWGTFDRQSWRADVHAERQPGDRDLVDLAAVESLRTGADVHAVTPERVPGDGPVAAIFRY